MSFFILVSFDCIPGLIHCFRSIIQISSTPCLKWTTQFIFKTLNKVMFSNVSQTNAQCILINAIEKILSETHQWAYGITRISGI